MDEIAVLIPCFNEEITVGKVVRDFKKTLPQATVYVYDNNSTDKTVEKAKEAGLVMTDAGATFPYGKDPHDSNIRIAPSYPTVEELKTAVEIFTLSVKLVSIDKILSDMLGI